MKGIQHILEIDDLFSDARALPLEIVTAVDDDSSETKYQSINVSLSHLERSLRLHEIFDYLQSEDIEQVWVDTIFLLDDISFFAILSLPMLRQYREDNSEVYTRGIPKGSDSQLSNVSGDEWHKYLHRYDPHQRKMMAEILLLAKHSKDISDGFLKVTKRNELKKLLFKAYEYCIEVVYLSRNFKK